MCWTNGLRYLIVVTVEAIVCIGCGSGVVMNNVLEVCDFPPTLPVSDMNGIFADLRATGAALKWTLGEEPLSALQDFATTTPPVTSAVNMRVFAVFTDSRTAAQILSSHSNSTYKLRPVDSIADSHGNL